MGFVAVRKARTPKWQLKRPDDPELREAHKIAVEHEGRFTRSLLRLFDQIATSTLLKDLRKNLADPAMTVEGVVQSIPWFNAADPESVKFWMQFSETLETASLAVMEDAGNATLKRQKIPLRFSVEKAADPIPPNPFSVRWAQSNAAANLEAISTTGQKTVRQAIVRGLEQGTNPSVVAEGIESSIGLTARQEAAAERLFETQRTAGINVKQARKNITGYKRQLKKQRAVMIARTETIKAESQGMKDAWQLADEQGMIPQGTVRIWIALQDDAICPICEDLDEQSAPIRGTFDSIEGPIEAPPAHPSCRCTLTLEVP